MGGNALAASGVAHLFGGGGLDVDAAGWTLQAAGQILAAWRQVRCQTRPLADHGDIRVAETQIFVPSRPATSASRCRLLLSLYSAGRCRENGGRYHLRPWPPAGRRSGHGSGHRRRSGRPGPVQIGYAPRPGSVAARNQPVRIKTVTDFHASVVPPSAARGQQQIVRPGDFEVAFAAFDERTGIPACSKQRCLVGALKPVLVGQARGLRPEDRPLAACGVWACHRRRRSTVAAPDGPAPRLLQGIADRDRGNGRAVLVRLARRQRR